MNLPTLQQSDAAKLTGTIVPRVIGDIKSVAKRISNNGEAWPEEIRQALRFFRELQDELDQQFPNNIK